MTEGRILAVVGVILCAVGGLLLLLDVVGGLRGFTVADVVDIAVNLVLLVIAFLAAVLIATRKYGAGGLIGIIGGAATAVVPGGSLAAGVLILLGGVLGIVAAALRD